MNRFLCIAFLVTLLGAFSLKQQVIELQEEKTIYQSNTEGLLTDIQTLKDDSIHKVHQISNLILTVEEYESYRAEDLKTIKDLQIKLKNIQAISKQNLEVKAHIEAPVVTKTVIDSIKTDTVQHVNFINDHISFNAEIHSDTMKADIHVPVEVTQVIHKIPKHKFLWWTWGCKGFKQVIVTNNPYVNLKYAESIELR